MSQRAGLSLTTIVVLLAILVGCLLGPLQGAYCVFLSGKMVGQYPLEIGKSIDIPLATEMNPIRFNARFGYRKPRSFVRIKSAFDGTLAKDDQTVWTQPFSVSHKDDDDDDDATGIRVGVSGVSTRTTPFPQSGQHTTTAVKSFDVKHSGDYQFSIQQTSSEIPIEEIELQVRKNVRLIHYPSCIAGSIMMLLGFVVGTVQLFRSTSNTPDLASLEKAR